MLRFPFFNIVSCFGYTCFCILWRIFSGPIVSWDTVHYHLYVAHAWWENRLPGELFAAGAQSYLNPLPHLPFYGAYLINDSRLFLAVVMALLHSINLWLLHFIACQMASPRDRVKRVFIVCGVFLGGLSPGFLVETGGSFADVVVSIPALSALLLSLIWISGASENRRNVSMIYAAGLLSGIAVGLKPTAIVFCGALFFTLVLLSGRQAWSVAWRSVSAGALGLLLTAGGHAWMLWEAFENPVFPMFNAVFQSSWYPSITIVADRFRPADLSAALRFPMDMANPSKRVSFEELAVDIRPVWLICSAFLTLFVALISRRALAGFCSLNDHRGAFFIGLLLVFFIPMWIATSGNIRYAVEALLLLGPIIAFLALYFSVGFRIVGFALVLVPLVVQAALWLVFNERLSAKINWDSWGKKLLDIYIPAPLDKAPAYYISMQTQSFAGFSPAFHRDSRFFNLFMFPALPPGSKAISAVESYRQAKRMPLRTLYEARVGAEETVISQDHIDAQNTWLSEYGYQVRPEECAFVELERNKIPHALTGFYPSATSQVLNTAQRNVLISCVVDNGFVLDSAERTRRKQIDARIDYWVSKCPRVFSPPITWSEQHPKARFRSFPNTDMQIAVLESGDVVAIYWLANQPNILLEHSDGKPALLDCPPRP